MNNKTYTLAKKTQTYIQREALREGGRQTWNGFDQLKHLKNVQNIKKLENYSIENMNYR